MKSYSRVSRLPLLTLRIIAIGGAMIFTAHAANACGLAMPSIDTLARDAVSEDPNIAAPAIAALRREGPAGLDALLRVHQKAIQSGLTEISLGCARSGPFWTSLRSVLDKVSGQKDSYASRLYWFTDLQEAGRVAAAEGKPILSLRLLGRLDEDLSCANSRFFRTALYANTEVSAYLRSQFILHWESVRPVPRLTIDFGDGRKLERTITGNSIHYVLTPEGMPVDALPGVYGPKAFEEALRRAEALALEMMANPGDAVALLRAYHQRRGESVRWSLNAQLAAMGILPRAHALQGAGRLEGQRSPDAVDAARIAPSKRAVEAPAYAAVSLPAVAPPPGPILDDATWQKLGELHADEARLDAASRSFIRRKTLTAREAARIAISKVRVEDPLLRAVSNFERSMAEDTVRNEYDLHWQIHEWFARGMSETRDVTALNKKVYADLFLMPDTDPWLGLNPADVYSALDLGGVIGAE